MDPSRLCFPILLDVRQREAKAPACWGVFFLISYDLLTVCSRLKLLFNVPDQSISFHFFKFSWLTNGDRS